MYCTGCGSKIPPNGAFCVKCGKKIMDEGISKSISFPRMPSFDANISSVLLARWKLILLIIIAIILILFAFRFIKSPGNNQLLGSWGSTYVTLEFLKNGKGTMTNTIYDTEVIQFSWIEKDGRITMTAYLEREREYDVGQTGIEYDDTRTWLSFYEKDPYSGKKVGFNEHQRITEPVSGDNTLLIGKWTGVEFFKNGTGIRDDGIEFKWRAKNKVLHESWEEESIFRYSLNDNNLNIFELGTFSKLGGK